MGLRVQDLSDRVSLLQVIVLPSARRRRLGLESLKLLPSAFGSYFATTPDPHRVRCLAILDVTRPQLNPDGFGRSRRTGGPVPFD